MQYFKHMTNMRHDTKIKRLINKYGLEGYGLYNLIIESITENITTDSPIPDLADTCDDIAEFYNGNSAKIDEMTRFMCDQGLIEYNNVIEKITCLKVYKFLEQSQTRSHEIRSLIANFKVVSDKSGKSQTKVKKRIEKNRTEENRIENTFDDSFVKFWELYNHKVNKAKSEKEWLKIKPDLHDTIFKHVIEYRQTEKGKKFPYNPNNYLKDEHWNDELENTFKEKDPLESCYV